MASGKDTDRIPCAQRCGKRLSWNSVWSQALSSCSKVQFIRSPAFLFKYCALLHHLLDWLHNYKFTATVMYHFPNYLKYVKSVGRFRILWNVGSEAFPDARGAGSCGTLKVLGLKVFLKCKMFPSRVTSHSFPTSGFFQAGLGPTSGPQQVPSVRGHEEWLAGPSGCQGTTDDRERGAEAPRAG